MSAMIERLVDKISQSHQEQDMSETKSTRELIDRYMGYSREPKSAIFRHLVDLMVAEMDRSKIAPDELRDAAFVASIKFLQMHPMDVIYRRDDLPDLDRRG
jgi:hypothetical protein